MTAEKSEAIPPPTVLKGPSRPLIVLLAIAMGLVILGYVFISLRSIQTESTIDRSLREDAGTLSARMLPPASAFATDQTPRARLHTFTTHLQYLLNHTQQPEGRFAQVQLYDPAVKPAASPLLWQAGSHPPVYLNAPLLGEVTKSGHGTSTGVQVTQEALEAYLAPLKAPPALKRDRVIGVVEVFQEVRP